MRAKQVVVMRYADMMMTVFVMDTNGTFAYFSERECLDQYQRSSDSPAV